MDPRISQNHLSAGRQRTWPRRIAAVLAMSVLAAGGGVLYGAGENEVELDFGGDVSHPNYITAREIEIRARNLNLLLVPDHPGRNLQDFQAELIPAAGLDFELRAPGSGRAYLYLDFVSFQPLENAVEQRVRWLEITVNGHLLHTLHQGGGVYVSSPVAMLIEREHAIDRRLRIRLRPSPGDGFFAIWDAYVSLHGPTASAASKRSSQTPSAQFVSLRRDS